jgi:hypothetical protein
VYSRVGGPRGAATPEHSTLGHSAPIDTVAGHCSPRGSATPHSTLRHSAPIGTGAGHGHVRVTAHPRGVRGLQRTMKSSLVHALLTNGDAGFSLCRGYRTLVVLLRRRRHPTASERGVHLYIMMIR